MLPPTIPPQEELRACAAAGHVLVKMRGGRMNRTEQMLLTLNPCWKGVRMMESYFHGDRGPYLGGSGDVWVRLSQCCQ